MVKNFFGRFYDEEGLFENLLRFDTSAQSDVQNPNFQAVSSNELSWKQSDGQKKNYKRHFQRKMH